MPYKDKKIQRIKNKEYQKKYYQTNKTYYKLKAKTRRKKLKIWFDNLKSTLKCSRCSENDVVCLEFHHLDPSKKEIGLSQANRAGWSKKRILKEIEKCSVLCSNCHKKLHAYE